MKSPSVPKTTEQFAEHLRSLKLERYNTKKSIKLKGRVRRMLTASEREAVLLKTNHRCHVCGGVIEGNDWQADHVLAHSGGGVHQSDNYLPAHRLCNNYRWDYSEQEFQHILKLGVWLRDQIEKQTRVGVLAASRYLAKEIAREKRRSKTQ